MDKADVDKLKSERFKSVIDVNMLCAAVFQDIVNNLEDGNLSDNLARKKALDIVIHFRPKVLELLTKL